MRLEWDSLSNLRRREYLKASGRCRDPNMNKCGIISYLCAAALASWLCGCTGTKHSSAPQAGNSSVTTNDRATVRVAPLEKPKIVANQDPAAFNQIKPVSPAASSPNVAKPETVNNGTIQTNVHRTVASAQVPVSQLRTEKSVPKLGASQPHLAATAPVKPGSSNWMMVLGVLVVLAGVSVSVWYVHWRSGSKARSKAAQSLPRKPASIPLTDFPSQ